MMFHFVPIDEMYSRAETVEEMMPMPKKLRMRTVLSQPAGRSGGSLPPPPERLQWPLRVHPGAHR